MLNLSCLTSRNQIKKKKDLLKKRETSKFFSYNGNNIPCIGGEVLPELDEPCISN